MRLGSHAVCYRAFLASSLASTLPVTGCVPPAHPEVSDFSNQRDMCRKHLQVLPSDAARQLIAAPKPEVLRATVRMNSCSGIHAAAVQQPEDPKVMLHAPRPSQACMRLFNLDAATHGGHAIKQPEHATTC